LVSDIKGRTQADGVRKWAAEDEMAPVGRNKKILEEVA
jgi:hypothetical protein